MREAANRPSRKVEEGHASSNLSERVARMKIDTSLSIIGRNLLKTSSLNIVSALESVTGAKREASTGFGGWTLPLSAYPWRKSIYPEGSFVS